MTRNNLGGFGRTAIGAIAAVVLVGSLAGCTAGDDTPDVTEPDPSPSVEEEGTPYVPEANEDGSVIISAISDCGQIGGYLGSLIDGLELTLESVDPGVVFCDWSGDSPESPVVSVEITGDGSIPVPAADVVAASGGRVIESPAADSKGGIVYALPGASGQAFALMAVLPDVAVSATAVGLDITDEQVGQLASAVENVLTPGGE
ncbi:hypothetical protein [Microbacterium amylolyticum]|uniref:DUF3558 domain-containing protein n=1 Tax=Microbacterium amylolyticum TaxID=936337 RepID=A0ABS4ZH42_9MICO|nr:hypothetical protein [Microbacterium amylolyticum]MBP2436594.1 hypothetical protein [Microbacterium amylolyticum]